MRSLHYFNGETLSPFPAEPKHVKATSMEIPCGAKSVLQASWASQLAPVAIVLLQQIFGFPRTPGTGGIVGEVAGRQGFPHIKQRLNYGPTCLHHVGALEQRGVTDHAVVQQTFVAGTRLGAE